MATTSPSDPPQTTPTTTPPNPKLPSPFNTSPPSAFTLITQGAEALLYKTTFLTPETHVALKIRPSKPWRHALLDRRLTRQRILAEARVLVKCRREGIAVPELISLDWEWGWIVAEWIHGGTVKDGVRRWSAAANKGVVKETGEKTKEEGDLLRLLERMGTCIGKLHAAGVVHGDLTTSNMMIRAPDEATQKTNDDEEGKSAVNLDGEIVLIDFGLATQTVADEDRAVDLYVLERAFGSTHPREEHWFEHLLEAYGTCYKGAKVVLRRLEDVRMRGRKKSMIG